MGLLFLFFLQVQRSQNGREEAGGVAAEHPPGGSAEARSSRSPAPAYHHDAGSSRRNPLSFVKSCSPSDTGPCAAQTVSLLLLSMRYGTNFLQIASRYSISLFCCVDAAGVIVFHVLSRPKRVVAFGHTIRAYSLGFILMPRHACSSPDCNLYPS